ncbi:MAG: FecR domain-containing protein [Sphingobacteriales bacterium]|nr:FecR domain-containing protein [Sphingobacteriales bacterium]
MKIPENIAELIEKYQAGLASVEELRLLNEWYHSFNESETELLTSKTEKELADEIRVRLLTTIQQAPVRVQGTMFSRWRIAAAAILLLMITAGIYALLQPKPARQELANTKRPVIPAKLDIAPGGDKAVLILADGSSILLDSAADGMLTQQGNIKVEKLSNGLLAYTIGGRQVTESDEAFYNTISTPRGGQYQVTLSDGTKVWLNAASSIRFPVLFTGAERRVEITGEAYFEVAKNVNRPFKVKASSSEIEVLGTHFNVNAYDDEATVKTTLLEGMVKVSVPASAGKGATRFLKPGQQSGVTREGDISVLNNADTEEAVAWKNGRFQFRSSDLKSILRQISRWYDVEVVYKGNVNLHFTGQLTRNEYVSSVFEKLALTGEVHFSIDGRKVIVSP